MRWGLQLKLTEWWVVCSFERRAASEKTKSKLNDIILTKEVELSTEQVSTPNAA